MFAETIVLRSPSSACLALPPTPVLKATLGQSQAAGRRRSTHHFADVAADGSSHRHVCIARQRPLCSIMRSASATPSARRRGGLPTDRFISDCRHGERGVRPRRPGASWQRSSPPNLRRLPLQPGNSPLHQQNTGDRRHYARWAGRPRSPARARRRLRYAGRMTRGCWSPLSPLLTARTGVHLTTGPWDCCGAGRSGFDEFAWDWWDWSYQDWCAEVRQTGHLRIHPGSSRTGIRTAHT